MTNPIIFLRAPSDSTSCPHPMPTIDLDTHATRSWVDRDIFMRYLGNGVGHLIHSQSGWQGNDDADVNSLPNDDTEPAPPNNAPDTVLDEPLDVGSTITEVELERGQQQGDGEDIDLPPAADDDASDDDSDFDDDIGSGGEEESGDESSDESGEDEEDDDGNLFDDEGFLDI
ncbi:hypothetical protein DFH09DRAFT_1204470 [Mycena vulgaris]|nr:hypothetical protein DFH09DRAFT_1204470 [Mycena vulgaris]